MIQGGPKYNATVYETRDGEDWGVFVAHVEELNGRLQMLSSNALQTYKWEGKVLTNDIPALDRKAGDAAYDVYIRERRKGSEFEIVLDDCAGYKARIAAMAGGQ